MNIKYWLMSALVASTPAAADRSLDLTYNLENSSTSYQFEDETLGGFERHKLAGGMKVRGWQIGKHTRFGQTRVNKKWGLGFVYEKGDTSYGVNHRGIQFNRKH